MDSSVSATKPDPPALPSLRAAPVFLSDSFEELLRFTLSASLVQDSEVSLGFSHEYCENLLRDDPFSSSSHISTIAVGGVPEYPLYKNLARALESCIRSGKFFRDLCSVKGLREDESFRLKQKEFDRLIAEKGAELVNIMEDVEFELHVQEPLFSQLKEGLKTAVGRCATEDYNRISAGALLLFNRCLLLEVQVLFRTSEGMVRSQRCLKWNLLMLFQASNQLKKGLGSEGVGALLGMMHTAGTVSDALPPPKSQLLSSFMKLYRPNSEGSTLTDAARSLAKHTHRSSEGWWGSFRGGDSEKNRLALEIVRRLLNECCWMNVYDIPTHGRVFEIRVHEGYGARWSHDGSKFIGFLEPYTEEGHSKGWKH
ncbi:uncharacterized protein LOC110027395 isoform X2 [Phalaenopsis equestris]|uniref:uncharacterized protein LOC110027395 isoform X2 n=1 Tax=Phalaenopsis equestris TaxID=78828 RepID=UPI0009E1F772|nr:uncharacterized protein LOC110027395 isoform X2 [Phalaenopsis equestris]